MLPQITLPKVDTGGFVFGEAAADTTDTDKYTYFKNKYFNDPAGFVDKFIQWKDDEPRASAYQVEILKKLPDKKRVAVRGPHGLGKTAMAAWIVLWFALTRDGEDWKIPTTASAWRQLTKFLWPEIKKWARRLKWDDIGRPPLNERLELLSLSIKLESGEAFALASDNSVMIEGAHADHLLYLFDESKAVPDDTWDSAEGAFASGDVYWLSISTPGEPQGRFYEIHKRAPGYEDWWVRHVTKDESIAAGRINEKWVEQRKLQWGEKSAVYQNRVMGEFATSDEDGVIPLAHVERAIERWYALQDIEDKGKWTCVGVDVGRGGDKSVYARRYDLYIAELERSSEKDIMPVAGRTKGILDKHGGYAVVDVIGIGAGVVDRCREQNLDVRPFNASERTDKKDSTGELGFTNKRSAAWWNVREMLDTEEMALPPDDKLIGDLTAPKWRVMSGGKIQVESKEDVKKRLKRSTDDGDAVIMAFSDMSDRWWINWGQDDD